MFLTAVVIDDFSAPPHMIKEIGGGIESRGDQKNRSPRRGFVRFVADIQQNIFHRFKDGKFQHTLRADVQFPEKKSQPKRKGRNRHDQEIDQGPRNRRIFFFRQYLILFFQPADRIPDLFHCIIMPNEKDFFTISFYLVLFLCKN